MCLCLKIPQNSRVSRSPFWKWDSFRCNNIQQHQQLHGITMENIKNMAPNFDSPMFPPKKTHPKSQLRILREALHHGFASPYRCRWFRGGPPRRSARGKSWQLAIWKNTTLSYTHCIYIYNIYINIYDMYSDCIHIVYIYMSIHLIYIIMYMCVYIYIHIYTQTYIYI